MAANLATSFHTNVKIFKIDMCGRSFHKTSEREINYSIVVQTLFEIFENRCGIRSFAGNVEEIWFEVSIGSENKKQFEMKEES